MVLLRKSFPQKANLQTAAELGVTKGKNSKATAAETSKMQKHYYFKNECSWVFCFGEFGFLSKLKNECFLSYASASTSFIAIERTKVLFARC